MDDFLKMDIFFVVATIAAVVFAALLSYALVLIIRILRNVERVSQVVEEEAQLLKGDIDEMRVKVRSNRLGWKDVSAFFRSIIKRLFSRTFSK